MTTRRKRGRLVVTSAPQQAAEGRRGRIAPAQRERMPQVRDAAGATSVLASAMLVQAAASPGERSRAGNRVRHARARLVTLAGRSVAQAIERQLRSDGQRSMRTAQLGAGDLRQHALASAVTFAGIAAGHGCEATASMALLGLGARWHALAHAELDAAATATGADRDRAVTRARYASQELRLALLGALALEREARQLGAPVGPVITPEAIERAVREAERAALAGSAGLAGDEPDGDEPDGDEPDGDDAPESELGEPDGGERPPPAPPEPRDPPSGGLREGAARGVGARTRHRNL